MFRLNYGAVADKLTCFEMEDGGGEQTIGKKNKEGADKKADAGGEAGREGDVDVERKEDADAEPKEEVDGEESKPETPCSEEEISLNRITFSGYHLREEEIR